MPTGLGLIAVLALVLLNGFFVAAEFALVSVRRSRIEQLASAGSARARQVRRALGHLDLSEEGVARIACGAHGGRIQGPRGRRL
jgi:CBS domain containing-hemolysin-like protein